MPGKLRPALLEGLVFRMLGAPDPSVLVGPAVGEDAAVIDLGGDAVAVVHSDAITGSSALIGWLAVHVAANDVAVRGVRPRWLLLTLLLPDGAPYPLVEDVVRQVDAAARELGVAVVGGHTEYTAGIGRPLASATAIGVGRRGRIVTTSGARAGDYVIMTKSAGLEGASIICSEFGGLLASRGVPPSVIERCKGLVRRVSVVGEALALAERGLATAMHDPTEGGVLGGAAELAYASKKTVELWLDRVPVAEEVGAVATALGVDVYRLISSGALLATVRPEAVGEALRALEGLGVEAAVIGRVKEWGGHLVEVLEGGRLLCYVDDVYVQDELFRLEEELGWGGAGSTPP